MTKTYERITTETLTSEMIETLSAEAGEHGDYAQVDICRLALDGDLAARSECIRVINNARAMMAD